jgi:hypothetical protein
VEKFGTVKQGRIYGELQFRKTATGVSLLLKVKLDQGLWCYTGCVICRGISNAITLSWTINRRVTRSGTKEEGSKMEMGLKRNLYINAIKLSFHSHTEVGKCLQKVQIQIFPHRNNECHLI